MSDLFAAIGKVQLDKFDEMAGIRKSLFIGYQNLFRDNKRISLFDWEIHDGMVPHIFVVRIPGMKNRQKLRETLAINGIPTGIHYKPNHLLTFYSRPNIFLPVTEDVYPEILTLPFHPRLTLGDIEKVASNLSEILENDA
jgi:dTDP-4-amino-4,6-dideoxygalactose transaminase